MSGHGAIFRVAGNDGNQWYAEKRFVLRFDYLVGSVISGFYLNICADVFALLRI
jgi:hypothetical protein